MGRVCAACDRDLPLTSYTTNQWSKSAGMSKCATCLHGRPSDAPAATQPRDAGRYNESSHATVPHTALDNPFASGAFRWVAKGSYQSGPRGGQACVVKWFKTGAVFEEDYFSLDIKASGKALGIVNRFNQLNILDKPVKINVPAIWTFEGGTRDGQKALCEPFIENYEKFNSNTGWTDESRPWARAMQALSHFSYHLTSGNYVLCDLQGGIYQREIVLSDPVILSRAGEYGVTDLGPEGISSFFSQHTCNIYCESGWMRPAYPFRHFLPVAGTTMVRRNVPTAGSRPAGTRFYG